MCWLTSGGSLQGLLMGRPARLVQVRGVLVEFRRLTGFGEVQHAGRLRWMTGNDLFRPLAPTLLKLLSKLCELLFQVRYFILERNDFFL